LPSLRKTFKHSSRAYKLLRSVQPDHSQIGGAGSMWRIQKQPPNKLKSEKEAPSHFGIHEVVMR
jgi:hypothetical protein